MRPTLQTRKPIDKLTVSDLSIFPVWEFAADEEDIEGRDETWVRPVNTRVVPKGGYSLQVAADFKAACGRGYSGLLGVTTVDEPAEIMGGVIVHDPHYLPIPGQGELFFEETKKMLLSSLGLSDSELFPITYTLRVLIEGEQVLRKGILG